MNKFNINEKHLVLILIIILLIYLIYCQNKKKEYFVNKLGSLDYLQNLTKKELKNEKNRLCKLTPEDLTKEYYHERELEYCTW